MRKKNLLFWSIIFLFGGTFHAQSSGFETWLSSIEQMPNSLEKAQQLNSFADSILWMGDATAYEAITYIKQALKICEQIDCGATKDHSMVMKILWDIYAKEENLVYTYALPQLEQGWPEMPQHRAYLYEALLLHYFFQGQLDSVQFYLEAERPLIKHFSPYDKRSRGFKEWMGFYHSYASNHDSAIWYMDEAAKTHLAVQDTLAFIKTAKYNSTFHFVKGDQKTGLEYLIRAREYIKLFPMADYFLHSVNTGIGEYYFKLGAYEDALLAFQIGLQDLADDNTLSASQKATQKWKQTLGLADTYLKIDSTKLALSYVGKALQICEDQKLDSLHITLTRISEADALIALKLYEKAYQILYELIDKAVISKKQSAHNSNIINLLSKIIGNLEIELSPEVIEYLLPGIQQIIDNSQEKFNDEAFAAYKLKTYLEIKRDNTDAALEDFQKTIIYANTILERAKDEAISERLIAYEAKEKAQQIQLQKSEIARKTWQRNTLILSGLVLLVFLAALFYFYQQKKYAAQVLEEAVVKRTSELQQANKELEKFNYIASHDLKEPLRNIMSFTGLIKRKLGNHEVIEDYYPHIERNVYQMDKLIDSVRVYSEIRENNPKFQVVALKNVAEKAKANLQGLIEERSAIVNIDEKLPTLTSDGQWLQLLFQNLIENGIKFNKNEKPELSIKYKSSEKAHHVIFKDNGIGIEKPYQQNVFDLFQRLHDRGTYQGVGMGLAICQRIVQNLEGNIQLSNSKNGGTKVEVILPD